MGESPAVNGEDISRVTLCTKYSHSPMTVQFLQRKINKKFIYEVQYKKRMIRSISVTSSEANYSNSQQQPSFSIIITVTACVTGNVKGTEKQCALWQNKTISSPNTSALSSVSPYTYTVAFSISHH